jgi:hypothetical protein
MVKITETEEQQLQDNYGPPLFYKDNKFKGLNEQFFAGYIAVIKTPFLMTKVVNVLSLLTCY